MPKISLPTIFLSFVGLSTCTTFFLLSGVLAEERNVTEPSVKKEYQITAPWDKKLYDGFFASTIPLPEIKEPIRGGIVPHHLVAGSFDATFFSALKKQKPSLIVLVGPDHLSRSRLPIATTERDWQTPYGTVATDLAFTKKMEKEAGISPDEAAMAEEHSIYTLVPFVAHALPQAQVISFIIRADAPQKDINQFVSALDRLLPRDAVVIASIDFSHYQSPQTAQFHDVLSRAVVRSFDYSRMANLEIDSPKSVEVLLKFLEYRGAQRVVAELASNSATITANLNAQSVTSYYLPFFVDGKKDELKTATLLHFGDIMLDRNVAKAMGSKGISYLLEPLAGQEERFFRGVDIFTANLEGPFADRRRPTSKEIAFRFDPALIPGLLRYHFSLFTLANNHSVDMGYDGDSESRANLKKAGIDFYGHQYSVEDDSYIVKDVGGLRIAFVGVNDTHPGTNIGKSLELIKKGKAEADFTAVSIHWGVEYQTHSSLRQEDLAHQFIDAGADIVIGHHPHVVEEMEVYKGHPIYYSLGNFIFDQYFSKETQEGLAVGLVFGKGESGRSIDAYPFPLQGKASAVRLKTMEERDLFFKNYFDASALVPYTVGDHYHFSL